MRYIVCLLICMGLGRFCVAQDKVKGLLKEIEVSPSDSLKAEYYKKLYEYYQYTTPDSAMHYVEQGLSYFRKEEYKPGIARMMGLRGQMASLKGEQERAKVHFNEALALYKEAGDDNGIAVISNNLGVIEGRTGNYLRATKYFLAALHKFEKTGNEKGIMNTYLKLGTVNDINNNLDKALDYFNKGLQIALKQKDERNTAYLYNSIGIVFCKKDMTDTGLVCFQKAYELSQSPEMLETKIHTIMHIGNAYKDLSKYNKALEYYDQVKELVDPELMPETYSRLLLNIATVKGLTNQTQALEILDQAGQIALDIGHRALYLEVLGERITLYQRAGDYKSAFQVLERSKTLQDSLFTVEKNTEIANLQSLHELQQSNIRVEQLEASEKSNTAQRNIIIAIAAILLLTLLALTFSYSKTNKLNRQLLLRETELQRSNAIKDRTFSIIGHDLRGPIANIPMVIELYKDPRTSAEEREYMLDLLTENSMASLETLDKLLHWGKAQIKGTAILPKEFRASHNVQHQVSLIKGIASNKDITLENKVPADTILNADEDHFNFVVRNLLSNAIKFTHPGGSVVVDADRHSQPGFTIFSVSDSGVGIREEELARIFEAFNSSTLGTNNEGGTSIGLMLCKEFVTENGGKIWVESEVGKGSTFYFTFRNA
ncbi:MAG: tetratricopeptide repeat protein [Flavipsychrobacter sp.]|nr:tetratricopeptide repeat protein [Flavipsychrobacter sp.]